MKVQLEVLASTTIKRKEPCQRMGFVGQVQESVFLFDNKSLSVLYMHTGKVKKKIRRLDQLMPTVIAISTSPNGHFVGGLQQSGDIFLWHKDSDSLRIIPSVPDIALIISGWTTSKSALNPYLCIAGDGTKVLLVLNYNLLFLWEMNGRGGGDCQFFQAATHARKLNSCWSQLLPPDDVQLPNADTSAVSISSVFSLSEITGLRCLCSIMYSDKNVLNIITVNLTWLNASSMRNILLHSYTTKWSVLSHSMDITPLPRFGVHIAQYSPDGAILALAVNGSRSVDSRMFFFSPTSNTVIISKMMDCGIRSQSTSDCHHWIADMQWLWNYLFLACIMKHGALSVFTRLGEPLFIQTYGCSLDMGPRFFLFLHPIIQLPGQNLEEAGGIIGQNFSLATHPQLPVILLSDGYWVTALQIPGNLTCLYMMKNLVSEARSHLRYISHKRKLLAEDSEIKESVDDVNPTGEDVIGVSNSKYRFEEEPSDMNFVDEDACLIPFGNFRGNSNDLQSTVDNVPSSGRSQSLKDHFIEAEKSLLLAIGLAASHTGLWTEQHDTILRCIMRELVRLFSLYFHSPAKLENVHISSEDQELKRTDSSHSSASLLRSRRTKINSKRVFSLLKDFMNLLHLDSVHRRLMVAAVRFISGIQRILLKDFKSGNASAKTLTVCCGILEYSALVCDQIYYINLERNSSPSEQLPFDFVGHLHEQLTDELQVTSVTGDNTRSRGGVLEPLCHASLRLKSLWQQVLKHLTVAYGADVSHTESYNQPKTDDQKSKDNSRKLLPTLALVQSKLQAMNSSLDRSSNTCKSKKKKVPTATLR